MSPTKVTFSVAVVTYNRAELVVRAIESVLSQARTDYEIVVVDNDSRDGTSEIIARRFPQVRLIRMARNLGCPDGRNQVYANCCGEFIVNLDDDGWMSEGIFDQLEAVFHQDERIGIVAMKQAFPGENAHSGRAMSAEFKDVGLFVGCASAFRRSMLTEIGSFPADFFLFAEESHLSIRALDAGYRIVSAPAITMWHPYIGGSHVNNKHDYQLFRNSLLVTLRLYPMSYLLWYFPMRIGSHFVAAIRRRSLFKYFRALLNVLAAVPATLMTRTPAGAKAVATHLGARRDWVLFKNDTADVALHRPARES